MAGKNQSQRIKIIDKYLRRGRKLSWENLRDLIVEELLLDDISERSIKGDIAEMRKGFMGLEPAPIKSVEGKYFYEADFNLFGSPIQDQETFALMNALDILNQFPDFDHSNRVAKVVKKLKSALDIKSTEEQPVISFEKVEYPAAGKWISQLYHHLKERNALKVSYQPFSAPEPFDVKMVPLLLKEFNGRWFLIGYNLNDELIRNYPLDRIKGFQEFYFDTSRINIKFNPNEYFQDLVGVSHEEEGAQEITFKCSEYISNYFKTKPLHTSQEIVGEAHHTFKIYCHINIELKSKLLSFGEDLEVISPKSLRDDLSSKIVAMYKMYS